MSSARPASGPPWDLPLAEAPLAFVDLEMTGLDPAKDRVVELCVERWHGATIETRIHTLVRPEGVAPTGEGTIDSVCAAETAEAEAPTIGNAHVHGIVAGELRLAPTFAELATDLAAAFHDAILVAHGARWDVTFLEAEMARAGRPMRVPFYIDTLNLSRRTLPLERHSLEALREHFGLDRTRAHRADADVAALRAVWDRCVAVLEPRTARDVWEVRVAERKAREQILAECAEAIARGQPVSVLYRPRSKPQEIMQMVLVGIATGLDPPRVIGYQLPGRGRRELRADRILRVETSPAGKLEP